jgi:hypothetical protein
MNKKLHIGTSSLSGTIFAGTLLKGAQLWSADKQDVTIECLLAVAEHALRFGSPVVLSDLDGNPEFRITVERIEDEI